MFEMSFYLVAVRAN